MKERGITTMRLLWLTLVVVVVVVNVGFVGASSSSSSSDTYQPQPLQLWPLPSSYEYGDSSVVLHPNFTIVVSSNSFTNQALEKGIERYMRLIFSHLNFDGDPNGLQA